MSLIPASPQDAMLSFAIPIKMYQIDPSNGDIVISGFEKGIGDSPETGLTDIRNIETVSIPGEAPIGFATSLKTPQVLGKVVLDVVGDTLFFATQATLFNNIAVYFSQLGSLTGPSTNTPYWLTSVTGASAQLSSSYTTATLVSLGGSAAGSPTFSTYTVAQTPKGTLNGNGGITYFAFDGNQYWGVDSIGQVWSTLSPLGSGNPWTFTGNFVPITNYYSGGPSVFDTTGNGLVFYEATDGTGYLFLFHGSSIDYTKTSAPTMAWNYQYNPTTGICAGFNTTPTKKLNTSVGFTGPHEAIVGQDSEIYYCDGNTVGSILPTNNGTYNPTNTATYTWNGGGNAGSGLFALALPSIDQANCLTLLGTNLLVGGQRNVIYPWDRHSTGFSYPIFLAENGVSKMVTVNTNSYIFIGNRGRIYITNGSQAQLYKKVPDHISGGPVPFFSWGGATFNRNELYFGLWGLNNAGGSLGSANTAYGGVWALNVESGAIRLLNKLSYGSYVGYATAIIAQVEPTNLQNLPLSGTGLHIGWANNIPATMTQCGIDSTISTPYVNGESYIVSDMIPIGTAIQPITPSQFEYKLSTPLLAGESVELQVGSHFLDFINNSFTSVGTTSGSNSTYPTPILSDIFPNKIQNQQWLIVKAILTGRTTNPSYNRLKELRVKGASIRQTSMSNLQ